MESQNVHIFQKDDTIHVEVIYENNSLWLSLNQIADLFDRDKSVISRHIKNIYKEKELPEYSTVAKNATVQKEGERTIKRTIEYYNLDIIIAVGYRVSSAKGTQFRIWATNILREHLINGYTKNEKRLLQLQQTIQLVKRTSQLLTDDKSLINILSEYATALDILDKFDHQTLDKKQAQTNSIYKISYEDAISSIKELRKKFGGSQLFGNEKDASFKSSIAVIDQTFDGKELYPSIEEKAANLLYFVVKNHSFSDGNKRIAAWLFVWYLGKNNHLFKKDTSKRIDNNTLVALTLMIAESNPSEKEMMINVVINLIS